MPKQIIYLLNRLLCTKPQSCCCNRCFFQNQGAKGRGRKRQRQKTKEIEALTHYLYTQLHHFPRKNIQLSVANHYYRKDSLKIYKLFLNLRQRIWQHFHFLKKLGTSFSFIQLLKSHFSNSFVSHLCVKKPKYTYCFCTFSSIATSQFPTLVFLLMQKNQNAISLV